MKQSRQHYANSSSSYLWFINNQVDRRAENQPPPLLVKHHLILIFSSIKKETLWFRLKSDHLHLSDWQRLKYCQGPITARILRHRYTSLVKLCFYNYEKSLEEKFHNFYKDAKCGKPLSSLAICPAEFSPSAQIHTFKILVTEMQHFSLWS